mmetsp:Transcript_12412/g.17997  ORF Transcript_12412/g.17997 Transcript_12412/m.17997 type:complete len:119 (+) Transcript_12412:197-553(+)
MDGGQFMIAAVNKMLGSLSLWLARKSGVDGYSAQQTHMCFSAGSLAPSSTFDAQTENKQDMAAWRGLDTFHHPEPMQIPQCHRFDFFSTATHSSARIGRVKILLKNVRDLAANKRCRI